MKETEIWKPVSNHPGYEVSNMGRVRSFKKRSGGTWIITDTPQRVLHTTGRNPGVNIVTNGVPLFTKVRTLVADAFLGPKPAGMQCYPKDGNVSNCQASNLIYCSRKKGFSLSPLFLSDAQIAEIRMRADKGEPYTHIALDLNVDDGSVRNCAKGVTYTSHPGPIQTKRRRGGRRFSPEQIRDIRQRVFFGETRTTLANEFKISISAISRIVTGKVYADV